MAKGYEVRDRQGRVVERDGDGVLRDGETLRVPMQFRDGMSELQRAVAEDADANAPMTVCDGWGRSDPVSLGIPGPRFLRAGRNTADHARLVTADAERQRAYAEMVDSMANAWKDAPPDAPPGSYPYSAAKEGAACTIDGRPGTLVKEGNFLVCRPVARADGAPTRDSVDEAWRQMAAEQREAWRNS
jgi:hypothetical protein